MSKQSVINAFIAGFYDGDGDTNTKSFRFSSNSENFLRVMQKCILAQGCPVNFRYRKNAKGKTLNCTSTFSFKHRYDILMKKSFKYNNGTFSNRSCFTYPARYIDNLHEKDKTMVSSKINNGIYRLKTTSYKNLSSIIKYSNNVKYREYLMFLREHILPVKIVSASNEADIDTYDLTVAEKSHTYIANNVYVSNCGVDIQKNYERFDTLQFFVFDVFDINEGRYLLPLERRQVVSELGLKHVPIIEECFNLSTFSEDNFMKEILKYAEGSSINNPVREGVVFKSNQLYKGMPLTFKSISNLYLEKHDTD